jgi:drug/metabolite transporter (DMT)-like permease
MLLAVALLREHIPVLVGSAMAVAGVLLVVYGPDAAGAGAGIVLTLLAVAARALYTVLTRRLIVDDASVSVVQQVAALGPALLVSAVVEDVSGGSVDLPSLTLVDWLGAVGLWGCVLRLRVLALPHRAAPQLGASGWFLHHPRTGLWVVGRLPCRGTLTPAQWVGTGVVVVRSR